MLYLLYQSSMLKKVILTSQPRHLACSRTILAILGGPCAPLTPSTAPCTSLTPSTLAEPRSPGGRCQEWRPPSTSTQALEPSLSSTSSQEWEDLLLATT